MKLEHLEKDAYYHIYNRGINGAAIFRENENKQYFLKLVKKYLSDRVAILAYCLMDNHYHMAIRVESDEKSTTQAFSNLLNAYAKAFNNRFDRTGSLFEKHFKRIRITDEHYLRDLIVYIHTNPQNHGVVSDFNTFQFSSYPQFFSADTPENVLIEKKEVLHLFEDANNMAAVHASQVGQVDLKDFEKHPHDNGADLQGGRPGRPHLAGHSSSDDLQGMREARAIPIGLNDEAAAISADSSSEDDGAEDLQGGRPGRQHLAGLKGKFQNYIETLQNEITAKLEEVDGKAKFREDVWERPEGGGGRSRIIENGDVFEKGGVNISAVHGELPKSMQAYFGVEDADFFACGLSLVLHPKSPMVPTVHANWRYFEMYDKKGNIVDQWFGGGQDLTPYYLFEEDAAHFHSVCKVACDKHHPDFHSLYKKRCDEYFWNAHRGEARGIGGLFFDYCKATDDMKMDDWYNFVTEVGNSFLESYVPIVIKRRDTVYTPEQRDWQEIRRGRYVEFNLVHDKGTLFGLKTNGRIESILMSLPPFVQWRYDHQAVAGGEEEKLLEVLKTPKEWI